VAQDATINKTTETINIDIKRIILYLSDSQLLFVSVQLQHHRTVNILAGC